MIVLHGVADGRGRPNHVYWCAEGLERFRSRKRSVPQLLALAAETVAARLVMPVLRRKPEQLHRVAPVDLFALVVGQRKRIQNLDSVADVAGALLLVERAIGSKQHVVGAEEIEAANRRVACPFDGCVTIKILEI